MWNVATFCCIPRYLAQQWTENSFNNIQLLMIAWKILDWLTHPVFARQQNFFRRDRTSSVSSNDSGTPIDLDDSQNGQVCTWAGGDIERRIYWLKLCCDRHRLLRRRAWCTTRAWWASWPHPTAPQRCPWCRRRAARWPSSQRTARTAQVARSSAPRPSAARRALWKPSQ